MTEENCLLLLIFPIDKCKFTIQLFVSCQGDIKK